MDKTLLDIYLPLTGKHYDFWVPNSLQIQTAAELISQALQLVEPDFYRSSANAALMYLDTGELQKPDATIGQIGFANGDRLALV